MSSKPPYHVPLMTEISKLRWNGLKVVSTFSGAGGYRMAGCKVVWANEFVPIAQASYKANAAGDSHLDGRDVKTIEPAEILAVTGLKPGELDIFDGSPPCQAFSTAGSREKGWGKNKTYEHGAKQKNETLFDEYIRLLGGLKPKVFVAENVSGLVKGVAKGYFLDILARLKKSGYRVSCRVLDAQWLGVPQARQRVIFIGVRDDLKADPVFPAPLAHRYSVRDALPWIVEIRQKGVYDEGVRVSAPTVSAPTVSALGMGAQRISNIEVVVGLVAHSGYKKTVRSFDGPSQTIQAAGPTEHLSGVIQTSGGKRKFEIAELKRLCAFPDDFVLCGSYAQQWSCLGNAVPPVMAAAIARNICERILLK